MNCFACMPVALTSIDGMCKLEGHWEWVDELERDVHVGRARERARAEFIERVPLSVPPSLAHSSLLPPSQAAAAWVVPLSLHFGELLLSS